MIALQLKGLDGLLNRYQEASDAMAEQVKAAVAETAQAIADGAKQNCNGMLKESIAVNVADDGMSAVISANNSDAVFVEYGAKTHEAHEKPGQGNEPVPRPFMNPAFEENAPKLLDRLNEITGQ